jgi:hypothetical protein
MENQFQILIYQRTDILICGQKTVKPIGSAECPMVFQNIISILNFNEYIARKYGGTGAYDGSFTAYVQAAPWKIYGKGYFRVLGPKAPDIIFFTQGFNLYGIIIHYHRIQAFSDNTNREVPGVIKRLGMTVLLFVFLVLPLSASMVSFMVVEVGLRQEANRNEYSSVWEDGMMGVFFDAGHIVSNSPVMRLEKISEGILPQEVEADYQDARRGGADYFVLVFLEYVPQGGLLRPQGARIRIFASRESVGNLIYEEQFPANTGGSLRDESARAQEAARIIMTKMKER